MRYLKHIMIKGITAIVVVILSLSSCNEDQILKEEPLDFLSTENLYSTVAEMNQAIYALHHEVRMAYYRGSRHQITILGGKGSDLSYDGENPAGSRWLTNWADKVLPTDNELVGYYWERSYQVIQYANVLIAAAEAIPDDDPTWGGDANIKNAVLGEAKFFRAFSYRVLVYMYGDVPLLTEPISTVKTDFSRASSDLVLDLMEEDLRFGAQHLPSRGNEEQPGRITRGVANHLLAETYLARENWSEAIAAASEVIDNDGYALMQERFGTQLGNDDPILGGGDAFYDLFRFGNQNLPENTETLWAVQIEPEIDGGEFYSGERMWGNAYYRMGADPAGFRAIVGNIPEASQNIYLTSFGRPVSWCKPTNYLAYDIWRSDWDNDIRNARHNIFRDWRYNNPESPWFDKPIDFVNDYPAGSRNTLNDTSQYIFPYFTKAASPSLHFTNPDRAGGGANHVDRYAFRLAETYLLRAEAHLGNGDRTSAAADINAVRNRAQATPVTPGEVSIDYLMDERARELYTESFRLLTMMRLGILYDRTIRFMDNPVASGGTPGAGIQPHNNKFPIPQSEIDLNINGNLEQNPGY